MVVNVFNSHNALWNLPGDNTLFVSEIPHLCLVQYLFDGTEHEAGVLPHGNSKRSHAPRYVRTKKSVVEELKEASASKKPKQAFHKVDVEKGGILNAKSESDLPTSWNVYKADRLARIDTHK